MATVGTLAEKNLKKRYYLTNKKLRKFLRGRTLLSPDLSVSNMSLLLT